MDWCEYDFSPKVDFACISMVENYYIIQDNKKWFIYVNTMASFNLSVFDHPDMYFVINEEV